MTTPVMRCVGFVLFGANKRCGRSLAAAVIEDPVVSCTIGPYAPDPDRCHVHPSGDHAWDPHGRDPKAVPHPYILCKSAWYVPVLSSRHKNGSSAPFVPVESPRDGNKLRSAWIWYVLGSSQRDAVSICILDPNQGCADVGANDLQMATRLPLFKIHGERLVSLPVLPSTITGSLQGPLGEAL